MALKRLNLEFHYLLVMFLFRLVCSENVSRSPQGIVIKATLYSKRVSDVDNTTKLTLSIDPVLPQSSNNLEKTEDIGSNSIFEEQSSPKRKSDEKTLNDLMLEIKESMKAGNEFISTPSPLQPYISESDTNEISENVHKIKGTESYSEDSTSSNGLNFYLTHPPSENITDKQDSLSSQESTKKDEEKNGTTNSYLDYSRHDISSVGGIGETSETSSDPTNSQKSTVSVFPEKMNEWLKTEHEKKPEDIGSEDTDTAEKNDELSQQETASETILFQVSGDKYEDNKSKKNLNETLDHPSHDAQLNVKDKKNISSTYLDVMQKWLNTRIDWYTNHLKLKHHVSGFTRDELDIKFEGKKVNQNILRDPEGTNVTLQLDLEGETIIICLDILKPDIFTSNASVTVIDSKTQTNTPMSRIKHLNVYEGYVHTDKESYVCGSMVQDTFEGVVMLTNGTVLYVEPQETLSRNNGSRQLVLYKGTDISYSNCSNNNNSSSNNTCEMVTLSGFHSCKREGKKKILCFEGKMNSEESPYPPLSTSENYTSRSTRRLRMETLKNSTCIIEMVADPSHFVGRHNRSVLNTLRELLVIVLQANRILSHLDLDSDGESDHFSLQVGHVALLTSHKDFDTEQDMDVMYQRLEAFRKRPQDYCMSLLFISMRLPKEPVSIAFGSGICRSNDNEKEPANNVALMNTISPTDGSRNLFATSWITTKTIGQMMGSLERDCEEALTYPFEDDWASFFSECRRHNIANMLQSQGYCLEGPEEGLSYRSDYSSDENKIKNGASNGSLCGNGRVDEGEECDCGTASSCSRKTSCCTPPGQENQCTFNRSAGHDCEWTDACCTMSCKIVPQSLNMFCGIGDPSCASEDAYCDGTTSKCPVADYAASSFDGRTCGPAILEDMGAGTCKNGYCNSTVCRDAGFVDCQCDSSSEENDCRVCCKNATEDKCMPAENFGLKSNTSIFNFKYPGTSCKKVEFGHCDRLGVCTRRLSSGNPFHTMEFSSGRMFSFALILWATFWHSLIFKIF